MLWKSRDSLFISHMAKRPTSLAALFRKASAGKPISRNLCRPGWKLHLGQVDSSFLQNSTFRPPGRATVRLIVFLRKPYE